MDIYETAAGFADRIEEELRKLQGWQSEPLPESAWESDLGFYLDTMTLFQWLQFVLVPLTRETVAERGTFPSESYVGDHATREFDGYWEAEPLIRVLRAFDHFINHLHQGSKKRSKKNRPQPPPAPLGPPPAESVPPPVLKPLEVVERYWQTRDPLLLHSNPGPRPSMDAQLAESVFQTATSFIEFAGEPKEIGEGIAVRAVIQADRGPWVVETVLCPDQDQWRVDIPRSLQRTTLMFLSLHQIHSPYSGPGPRDRAMQFWQFVLNHRFDWARELVIPESPEIPSLGQGQMDEFFWYVSHTEGNGKAAVRVLMNLHDGSRMWLTYMVQRDGAWFVDLPTTIIEASVPSPTHDP